MEDESREEPEEIVVRVESLFATAMRVRLGKTATVRDLKRIIREGSSSSSVPIHRQEIIFRKKALEDNKLLTDCGIIDGSSVQLVPRIRTGTRDIKPSEDYSEQGMERINLMAFLMPCNQSQEGLMIGDSDGKEVIRHAASDTELSSRTTKKRKEQNERTKERMDRLRTMIEQSKQDRMAKRNQPQDTAVPKILRPCVHSKSIPTVPHLDTMEELSSDQIDWTESETDSQTEPAEEKRQSKVLIFHGAKGMKKRCAFCGKYRLSARFFKCACHGKFCLEHKKPESHDCPLETLNLDLTQKD